MRDFTSPRLARASRRLSIQSRSRAARVAGAVIEALEQRRMLNAAIVVNTTDDESIANATTSLREAVALAESQAGDDTITFDPTVFDSGSLHTITLGAELIEVTGANGGLTITGPGAGVLAISSTTSGRAFGVDGGAIATITDMTMRDGSAQGGAVYNQGNLSLTDVLITNNTFQGETGPSNPSGNGFTGDDALGGAIYNTGQLTLTTSTLSNNSATAGNGGGGSANGGVGGAGAGAGVYSTNQLIIQSCTFSGNVADGGNGGTGPVDGGAGGAGFGGAVYVASGTLDIEDSDFESNEAKGGAAALGGLGNGGTGGGAIGGTIYCDGALTLNGSQLNSGEAAGGAGGDAGFGGGGAGGVGEGGSIYASGTVTGTSNTIATSAATGGANGGTILGDNGASGGEGLGGSLMLASTASGSLVESNFNDGSAVGGVGGAAGGLGTAGDGGLAVGGGAAVFCADFTFQSCQFSSDFATGGNGSALGFDGGAGGDARGGGLYYNGTGTLKLIGGNISDCEATGGTDGAASFGNTAGAAFGGGIDTDGKISLSSILITDNTATGGDGIADAQSIGGGGFGGGVQATNNATFVQAIISNNKATGGFGTGGSSGQALGGGVEISGGTFSVQTSSVTGNSVTGGTNFGDTAGVDGGTAVGAGIYAAGSSNTITSSLIYNNNAAGGNGNTATPTGSGGNGGAASGAGIYAATAIKITDSTVFSNTATGGNGGTGATSGTGGDSGFAGGAGIYGGNALTLINDTVTSNTAKAGVVGAIGGGTAAGTLVDPQGGGVFAMTSASLTNNIVANNTATDGPDVFGTIDASHNLIKDTSGITFNTNVSNLTGVDPQLGSLADNGGLSLTLKPNSNSPVFNAGDTAAALAEFGANGTDQRGPGFPRFLGPVDIGAVESGIAVIQVSGNGNTIVNNDTTPSATDFTDFGTTDRAAANPLERMFTVSNLGQLPLTLSAPVLPAGYSIVEGLSASIDAGSSDTFAVRLSDLNAGVFSGNIVINTNDPNNPVFTFKITGTISSTIRINFEPAASPIPDTFAADTGSVFGNRGNGLSYGWNANASSFARDRNLISDQAKDTFIHTQLYGTRTWEISVPNGAYQVHLVAGDPQYIDSTYKIDAESTLLVNGKPTSGNHFVEGTATIIVTDGRLTLSNAAGAVNNKFDYVEITPVTTPSVKINFETTTSPTPAGYLPDTGSVFGDRGNGFSYGWNLSATSFARDRNALNSPNQQQDTFIHTELYGNRFWELALPNGNYSVTIVAGDPDYTDSVDKYNLEGILALSGTPTNANHWVQGTVTVAVTDGRLTLTNASGSVNNKIDYIEVTPV